MDTRLKKYLSRLAIALAAIFLLLSFSFSYFNIFDSCYIKIKEPGLASRKSEIKEAIKYLKITDREAYKNFCRHTDSIIETVCMGSDWHLNEKFRGQDSAGCFIKGSKTIYLNPLVLKSLSVEEVADLLKKYSLLGKEFWDSGL
jgi:hypothetical protein